MIIGFTGTQIGMNDIQKANFFQLLKELECHWFHHGDCTGADENAHNLVVDYFRTLSPEIHMKQGFFTPKISIHPPVNESKRAFCKALDIRPAKPYLDRNRDIVNESDILIGTPKEKIEQFRYSGTWYTIRYARKTGKKVYIIYPDGQIEKVNMSKIIKDGEPLKELDLKLINTSNLTYDIPNAEESRLVSTDKRKGNVLDIIRKKSMKDLYDKYVVWDDKNVKGFFEQYRFLSNFHIAPVMYAGGLYKSTEHAYQAAKSFDGLVTDPNEVNKMTCSEVRKWGQTLEIRKDWDNVKYDIMLAVVFDKFWRNDGTEGFQNLRQQLLDTWDKYLEETNSWRDEYWGVNSWTGKGENMLGKILMKVRECLRK